MCRIFCKYRALDGYIYISYRYINTNSKFTVFLIHPQKHGLFVPCTHQHKTTSHANEKGNEQTEATRRIKVQRKIKEAKEKKKETDKKRYQQNKEQQRMVTSSLQTPGNEPRPVDTPTRMSQAEAFAVQVQHHRDSLERMSKKRKQHDDDNDELFGQEKAMFTAIFDKQYHRKSINFERGAEESFLLESRLLDIVDSGAAAGVAIQESEVAIQESEEPHRKKRRADDNLLVIGQEEVANHEQKEPRKPYMHVHTRPMHVDKPPPPFTPIEGEFQMGSGGGGSKKKTTHRKIW
jgi:ribosome-associated protein YbcJ (S4-like RNA binding protein)